LAQSNYSRNFEIEADAGAAKYCHSSGWSTLPMRRFFLRMKKDQLLDINTEVIASHPDLDKRIKLLEEADRQAGKPVEEP
jgi:Zn-dependent protease with chaperone function